MNKNRFTIIRELIVLFGFLNGIWTAMGINPQAEIFKYLNMIINLQNYSYMFTYLPIIITIFFIAYIFIVGRLLRIAAVSCGYAAGLLILVNPIFSIVFLFLGFALGFFASKKK